MKLLVIQLSLVFYYLLRLRLKYLNNFMFFPLCDRPSFTLVQHNTQSYSFLYCTICVFREQDVAPRAELQQTLADVNLLSFSSRVQFGFVSVVPEHTNVDSFKETGSYQYFQTVVFPCILFTKCEHTLSLSLPSLQLIA